MYRFRTAPIRPTTGDERGSALVWALFFVALTTGLLISHSMEMEATRRDAQVAEAQRPLSRDFAHAALTDANAWFQHQTSQPVVEFAPRLEPEADPPLYETIDPELGLVREFEVHGSLWGRYEVRRSECLDVSSNYGSEPGSVWDIGARGILFQRVDPKVPYDRYPNRVLSVQTVRSELRGLPIRVPAQSAVVLTGPGRLQIGPYTRILGGAANPAIAVQSSGTLMLAAPVTSVYSGTPTMLQLTAVDLRAENLFKVRPDKLRMMADLVAASPSTLPPGALRDQLFYADRQLTLGPRSELRGRMLLYVGGDFVAQAGNDADISGVVVVRGNATIAGPFHLQGTLIVQGTLQTSGTPDDPVTIAYDPAAVDNLTTSLSRYRRVKDTRPSGTSGAFTSAVDYNACAK